MRSRSKASLSAVQPILITPNEVINRLDKFIVLDVQNLKYATKMLPKAQRSMAASWSCGPTD
jgi:hypothetical protein